MSKNTKIIIGSFVIMGAILVLLFTSTPAQTGVELTITELINNPDKYKDKFITLQGNLNEQSIHWDADKILLEFTILDDQKTPLNVRYNGIRPDNFSHDVIVIADGKYDPEQNLFIAETVKTRCPSKYEAPGESDSNSKET
ncbi:cytochrome c maturation protein CcmE [Microaerobacter geothermalis]|uniref:cytochrome c maturation protein CcmE n=1 Tax=Microaerobacter geothermalis TaxID=674972 RepID=UPI001F33185B|nr:cytochrome c maturation protein CcmE [Microaerobacter geothermalis]MCF6095156.1 cytochrome c maturation protein CcmE [Microaerobacter geothermalis]